MALCRDSGDRMAGAVPSGGLSTTSPTSARTTAEAADQEFTFLDYSFIAINWQRVFNHLPRHWVIASPVGDRQWARLNLQFSPIATSSRAISLPLRVEVSNEDKSRSKTRHAQS